MGQLNHLSRSVVWYRLGLGTTCWAPEDYLVAALSETGAGCINIAIIMRLCLKFSHHLLILKLFQACGSFSSVQYKRWYFDDIIVGPKELNSSHWFFLHGSQWLPMAAVQHQNNPSISLKYLTYSNHGVHKNAKYINQIKSANSFKNAYINWLTNIYNPDH